MGEQFAFNNQPEPGINQQLLLNALRTEMGMHTKLGNVQIERIGFADQTRDVPCFIPILAGHVVSYDQVYPGYTAIVQDIGTPYGSAYRIAFRNDDYTEYRAEFDEYVGHHLLEERPLDEDDYRSLLLIMQNTNFGRNTTIRELGRLSKITPGADFERSPLLFQDRKERAKWHVSQQWRIFKSSWWIGLAAQVPLPPETDEE